jgi:hypothetical protein
MIFVGRIGGNNMDAALEMKVEQLAFELDYFSGMSDLYDYLCTIDDSMPLFRERRRLVMDYQDCCMRESRFFLDLDHRTQRMIVDKCHLDSWY